ncbi:hypothetical protein AC1031_017277 [Aphanomyces cochlioides]|nr:hypothetical protein AC1031_017277 [Aphanomyces cochlioides]
MMWQPWHQGGQCSHVQRLVVVWHVRYSSHDWTEKRSETSLEAWVFQCTNSALAPSRVFMQPRRFQHGRCPVDLNSHLSNTLLRRPSKSGVSASKYMMAALDASPERHEHVRRLLFLGAFCLTGIMHVEQTV